MSARANKVRSEQDEGRKATQVAPRTWRSTGRDRDILRELGAQIAEISTLPAQLETRAQWRALNGLKPVRPMVAIDQLPWHELSKDEPELTVHSDDPFCRGIETQMRRTLYSWNHMRADMVVEPEILVPKVLRIDGFGIAMEQETAILDPTNDVVGHYYIDQLATEEDVEKIRPPVIDFDAVATARVEEQAHEIFDGVVPVRLQGWVPGVNQWPGLEAQPETRHLVHDWPEEVLTGGFNLWDIIAFWRGANAILLDLVDRPDHMHQIMSRLTDAFLSMLDEMEARGLLGSGQATIHCSPAYTEELPHPGFDPARPRAEDLWTMGMGQILTSVSPAMFKEFEVAYTIKWYARFGLGYYGCCDVLDKRINLIRTIPHVRKVSMSPWANVERGAEAIGQDFVFSRKPNPAFLATDSWEPDAVAKDLEITLEACRRNGTPLEFILKDVSTIRYDPHRLWDWVDTAMRLVRQ
jgi:hypothetical protein